MARLIRPLLLVVMLLLVAAPVRAGAEDDAVEIANLTLRFAWTTLTSNYVGCFEVVCEVPAAAIVFVCFPKVGQGAEVVTPLVRTVTVYPGFCTLMGVGAPFCGTAAVCTTRYESTYDGSETIFLWPVHLDGHVFLCRSECDQLVEQHQSPQVVIESLP